MRKILFAALVALASAAPLKNKVYSYSNDQVIIEDASPATQYQLSIQTEFDFGYGLDSQQEPAADDGVNGPLIQDNWVQAELWSEASIGFTLNILGMHICRVNVDITPLHIVPLWFSIYNTHPYRYYNGDNLNIFTEMGYELHFGEFQFQYVFSNFLPHVSLYDYLFNSGDITPVNALSQTVADISVARTDVGWDYTDDIENDLIDDPYLNFNAFQYLLDQ